MALRSNRQHCKQGQSVTLGPANQKIRPRRNRIRLHTSAPNLPVKPTSSKSIITNPLPTSSTNRPQVLFVATSNKNISLPKCPSSSFLMSNGTVFRTSSTISSFCMPSRSLRTPISTLCFVDRHIGFEGPYPNPFPIWHRSNTPIISISFVLAF